MQISKTRSFLSSRDFKFSMLAATFLLVGLAFLAWILMPTAVVSPAALPPTRLERSLDVIAAFHSAGLYAEVVRGLSKDERDGVFPVTVVDSSRFRISSTEGETGMVLSFENYKDLERVQNYYLSLNRFLPQFRSRLFVKDNILLQINHEVPEAKARAYAAVLGTLDQ